MKGGNYVHMLDPNITHTESHKALAKKEAYAEMADPTQIMERFEMLEAKEEKEPGDGA